MKKGSAISDPDLPALVRRARPDDIDRITMVLDAAFSDDPVSRWVFPEHPQRDRWHRGMFRVFAEWSIMTGGAYVAEAPDIDAAALWIPAGPDTLAVPPQFPYLPDLQQALGPAYPRFVALFEHMDVVHPRDVDHAYLPFIGVLPECQDHGLGRLLMRHRLDELDKAGTPAYLEATSLRAVSLYEHLGFDRTRACIRLDQGPALWPMWRRPYGIEPEAAPDPPGRA